MGDKVSVALSLILEIIPLINVLLVDDHELVRAGIRRILEDIKGIKVAGEACCGEDAVKWCRANSADVVLMDMNMPGIGGLEATRKIARSVAGTKVIMLTVHTENPLPAKVMQAGAAGYLSKRRRAAGSGECHPLRRVRAALYCLRYCPANGVKSD